MTDEFVYDYKFICLCLINVYNLYCYAKVDIFV